MLLVALSVPAGSGCAARAARIPGPLAAVGRADGALVGAWEPPPESEPRSRRREDPTGNAITEAARHYLEHRPQGFRDDCSGYVEAVFARAGIPMKGSTRSFYELAESQGALHHHKMPRPGDLAFFDDTYDRDHNGRVDDPLSHIAVVLDVSPDGTILLGHGGTSRGRTTLTMNLKHPAERQGEDGTLLNDWLRVRRDSDPAGVHYLAGELWRAFATLDAEAIAEP